MAAAIGVFPAARGALTFDVGLGVAGNRRLRREGRFVRPGWSDAAVSRCTDRSGSTVAKLLDRPAFMEGSGDQRVAAGGAVNGGRR